MTETPLTRSRTGNENLLSLAKERTLTSDELLALMSRSFYKPIQLLEIAKGSEEVDKRPAIRCAYNILRECDTIEDGKEGVERKDWALDKIGFLVSQVERRNGEGIQDILTSEDFKGVTEVATQGARTEDERVFAEHFGKGPVLLEMHGLPRPVRDAINYCTGRMILGMEEFIQKGPIQSTQRLMDYCFYVAGSVGDSLSRIILHTDKVELNKELAESFGQYLQLVNIIKGIQRDWTEDRIYVPADMHPNESHEFLMQGKGPDADNLRRVVLSDMCDLANKNFANASEYLASIPAHVPGYRTFCTLPFIGAQQTLQVMSEANPNDVFAGREEAIKVPDGTFTNIGNFIMGLRTKESQRVYDWLASYRANPRDFSFKPGEYESWSERWTKE
ncbi:squalene/phytoene synthase family protein [Candidatus Pacearchaeota archaeon]|nr:squalene/phytoene synthase family protein [Candidatus Pacearchaeota archaeon]